MCSPSSTSSFLTKSTISPTVILVGGGGGGGVKPLYIAKICKFRTEPEAGLVLFTTIR